MPSSASQIRNNPTIGKSKNSRKLLDCLKNTFASVNYRYAPVDFLIELRALRVAHASR